MESYEGKAKIVRGVSEREVDVYYKDDATAFNGEKFQRFQGKGALNSRITERLFRFLSHRGIPNHHVERIDEVTLRSLRVTIVPLEVVTRFRIAGSLQKRTGLDYLTACEPPVVEFYYKRDDLGDPLLNRDHVRLLGLATDAELDQLRDQAIAAATALRELFHEAGIDLVDLKFEYGRTPDGELLLADEISPDTCRFRDRETGEILDKDLFRFGKGDLISGYQTLLERLDEALVAVGMPPVEASPEAPHVQG